MRWGVLTLSCFLCCALLKAQPEDETPYKVEGLELPAPQKIDLKKQKYVYLKPKFDPDWTVKEVSYFVISDTEEPLQFTDLGEQGCTVASPPPDHKCFVYAYAVLTREGEKPVEFPYETEVEGKKVTIQVKARVKTTDTKITKAAVTMLVTPPESAAGASPDNPSVPSNTNPPATGPTSTSVTPIPVGVKGLHVILIYNIKGAPPELSALVASEVIKTYLAKSESLFYAYAYDNPEDKAVLDKHKLSKLVTDLGKVPCLIIMDSNGTALQGGKAVLLPLTGDPKKTEALLVDMVGKAAQNTGK